MKLGAKQQHIINLISKNSNSTGWAFYFDIQNAERGMKALEKLEAAGLIERQQGKGQRLTELGKQYVR